MIEMNKGLPNREICNALDELIHAVPEEQKGALEVQLNLDSGVALVGAIRKHATQVGVYIMTTLAPPRQGEDPRNAPKRFVDVYMRGQNIYAFGVPKADSVLVQPTKGLFSV